MILLPQIHIGRGAAFGAVTVFPVWSVGPSIRGLATGPSAPLVVSEIDGAPSVNALQVHNTGEIATLLLEGELLEGGLQNRAVDRDVILAPHSRQLVDVSCVEQHRWRGGLAHPTRARRASPRVQLALRGDDSVRQGDVWAGVQRYETLMGATPTASLSGQLDRLTPAGRITPVAGQRGVLIGLGGQPLMLELFGSSRALTTHLPALLDAAGLDAAVLGSTPAPVPGRRARRMITRIAGLPLGTGGADAGSGCSIRADGPHLVGRGVATSDGRIAHLNVLNTRHPLMEVAA